MFTLTIFKNTYDNKTDKTVQLETLEQFSQMLLDLSVKKGSKGGTNSSPLISPAVYVKNSTRSNRNVECWGRWCAVDVDDFDIHTGDLHNTIQNLCGEYHFMCYSTASSTPKEPKFRLVFPLTESVDSKNIPHFWYALNERLESLGDKQTKDLSRMYYVPAQYPEAFNFIFENKGELLDPITLMNKYPYKKPTGNSFLDRLPDSLREEVINYRKNKNTNTVSYSGYQDCPFFPKTLTLEYKTITGTGWYHKMYQIMVATAAKAIEMEHNITASEIANLCRELDNATGKWYDNRPLEKEADRAIEYVYRNL
jgi:hypothetical protein